MAYGNSILTRLLLKGVRVRTVFLEVIGIELRYIMLVCIDAPRAFLAPWPVINKRRMICTVKDADRPLAFGGLCLQVTGAYGLLVATSEPRLRCR